MRIRNRRRTSLGFEWMAGRMVNWSSAFADVDWTCPVTSVCMYIGYWSDLSCYEYHGLGRKSASLDATGSDRLRNWNWEGEAET